MDKYFIENKSQAEEDSELFSKDNRAENKKFGEKWADMSGREKAGFFKDYILPRLLIAAAIVTIIVLFVVFVLLKGKTDELHFFVCSPDAFKSEAFKDYGDAIAKRWDFNRHQEVVFEERDKLYGKEKETKVLTEMAATLDIYIGYPGDIASYSSYILNLEDVLSGEMLNLIPESTMVGLDRYYKGNSKKTMEGKRQGIKLSNTIMQGSLAPDAEKDGEVVLCFSSTGVFSSDDGEKMEDFIRFLLGE